MKTVKELIKDIMVKTVVGDLSQQIDFLTLDSRKMTSGGLFVAQKGTKVDGHQYIPEVIEKGAKAILCEELPKEAYKEVCFVVVADSSVACGLVAAAFYNHPTSDMKVVGVTGTNGKTTVATLLFKLFKNMGHSCGLISTVQYQIKDNIVPAIRTTPDAILLQELLGKMRDAGCDYVFMEASSHAIVQNRIGGIAFDGAIFTNITHEHLDYHKTFDNYIKAKKKFFDDLPAAAFALSNMDDKRGMIMLQNTKADKKYYGIRKANVDFKAKVLSNDLEGLQLWIANCEVHFRLIGLFNAYNLLAVYGAAVALGFDEWEVLKMLSALEGAPGRFETHRSQNKDILGIIDYAHTPDALLNVLTTIRYFNSVGQVITVVGCGGNRDKSKRPEMAQVACKYSDKVILTSDNPRFEDPEAILEDMEAGLSVREMKKVIRIADRKEAIKTACSVAEEKAVILIAGKGHETYQEIKGKQRHFDDKEVLNNMFELLER